MPEANCWTLWKRFVRAGCFSVRDYRVTIPLTFPVPIAPGCLVRKVLPSLVPSQEKITHRHEVQFYSDEAALVLGLAGFIEAALNAGTPVIVVATEPHRKGLLRTLLARGIDAAAAMEQGLYLALDVYDALSTFMVNDLPDSARFLRFLVICCLQRQGSQNEASPSCSLW